MFNFLEKIRQKPEHERHHILIASSVIITLLIVFIWGSLLYARYLGTSQQKKTLQHTASPFEVFFKDLGGHFESFKSGYKSVEDIISDVSLEINTENFAVSSSTETAGTTTQSENLPLSKEEQNP
ncbi:MAG: hypothetical protein U1D31_00120 [Patescibacteria group bacterium]|nr:hypothetical protein [bacterium]MDZ4240525.1 hypothetical protein [Patescibacteria group bacterium]